MKVKLSRTTRPEPGKTLGFQPETLFTMIELSVENICALAQLRPEQIVGTFINEEEDRVWAIKDPLMFHTVVSTLTLRGRHGRENTELIKLVDLMKDYLTDNWTLSWSTMEDLQLEIFINDLEGI